MDSPRLRDEFVIAILEDSTPLMNLERMRRWLNNYVDGLLFLIAAIEVLARSPSWGTELVFSLETHLAGHSVYITLAVI